MIICNGPAKTGTNILLRCCALMGLTDSEMFLVQFVDGAAIKARQRLPKLINGKGKQVTSIKTALNFDNTHFCHAHVCHNLRTSTALEEHKILNIMRDPRDAAVSYIRWAKKRGKAFSGTKEDLIRLLKKYNGKTWVDTFKNFEQWEEEPNVLSLDFDTVFTKPEIEKIVKFIGIDCDIDYVFENLHNSSDINGKPAYTGVSSYSGKPSKWEDWWDDDVQKVWSETGGT